MKRCAANAFSVWYVRTYDDDFWSKPYGAIQHTVRCTTNEHESWQRFSLKTRIATVRRNLQDRHFAYVESRCVLQSQRYGLRTPTSRCECQNANHFFHTRPDQMVMVTIADVNSSKLRWETGHRGSRYSVALIRRVE